MVLIGTTQETEVSFITTKSVQSSPSICTDTVSVVAAKLYPKRVILSPPAPLFGVMFTIMGPTKDYKFL